jgi:hypothetical protein
MSSKRESERIFSYVEFRRVTGLSKREADKWVQHGLIQAELSATGRRRLYRQESLLEGIIAKQLADFASRELLLNMMTSLREFFMREEITLTNIPLDPQGSQRRRVQLYTQRSGEIVPGLGVRGVITYVKWYEPSSPWIGKGVYLVVDLTVTALAAKGAIDLLPPA